MQFVEIAVSILASPTQNAVEPPCEAPARGDFPPGYQALKYS
jgi:hypothetical protein